MADKQISQLTAATQVNANDLFVLEQSSTAKKLTGQILENWLLELAEGHGGITNISYTAPSSGSLNGTLTITLADNTTSSFTVTNGRGITSISKTGTSTLTDTYTISYNNNTTSTFQVSNGRGIDNIAYSEPEGNSLDGTVTISYNDNTSSSFVVTNGRGIDSVTKTAGTGTNLTDSYHMLYNDGTYYDFTLDNGNGVASVTQYYAVSDRDDTTPQTWHDEPQMMTAVNRFLWSYQRFTRDDGTTLDTTPSVIGAYGETGQNWYVHIKYSDDMPTSDSDIGDVPSTYIGVYSGTSADAPTAYTAYTWYHWKGLKGDTGTSITSVTKTATSGVIDTYTVQFSNNTSTTFTVTNGTSIQSIAKTSTVGLVDTYTVTLTSGATTQFQVSNAKSITSVAMVGGNHAAGTTDTYQITFNDGDTAQFSVYNGANGSGAVSTVAGIGVVGDQGNVPLILQGQGAPTPSTIGQENQLYFDQTGSAIYICLGENGGTYSWMGTSGITVDQSMSTSSTNPVQNRVISSKVGVTALNTTAQDCSGAINEHESDIGAINTTIGSTVLPTTAQTLTGAIAEHDTDISGKVSKSGDTMTGNLGVASTQPCVYVKDTDRDSTATTTATSNGLGFRVTDQNDRVVALMTDYYTNTDLHGLWLAGSRYLNNNQVWNSLNLYVDANGNKSVNVSDPAAWRTALSAVNKAGDTMTGDLTISKSTQPDVYLKNTAIDTTAATLSSTQYGYFALRDANDKFVGYFESAMSAEGTTSAKLGARRVVNGSNVTNYMSVGVDANGNKSVNVSDPAAWRTALSAVDKTGDTMTGDLVVYTNSNPSLYIRNSDMDSAASSISAVETCTVYFRDKNNRTSGYVQSSEAIDGKINMLIGARRYNSGDVSNMITLSVDKEGNRAVALTDAAAWRSALGLGTSGAFPLTIAQGGTGQTATTYTTFTMTLGSNTGTAYVRKFGNIVNIFGSLGGSSFSSFTSAMTLGTIPSGYRPVGNMNFPSAQVRTIGTWATATYYPCTIGIETNGALKLYGNGTDIKSCLYMWFNIMFIM